MDVIHFFHIFSSDAPAHVQFSVDRFLSGELAVELPGNHLLMTSLNEERSQNPLFKKLRPITYLTEEAVPRPELQYDARNHSFVELPEKPRKRRFWDLRWLVNSEERSLRALTSHHTHAVRALNTYLRVFDELIEAGGVDAYLSRFQDIRELNAHLRELTREILREVNPEEDIAEIIGGLTAIPSVDSALPEPVLNSLREKQKDVEHALKAADRAIDPSNMTGFLKKVWRKLFRKGTTSHGNTLSQTADGTVDVENQLPLEEEVGRGVPEDRDGERVPEDESPTPSDSTEESVPGGTDKEHLLLVTKSPLRLKNWKFRSNLSMRSGVLLLTERRLITYRRKFSLFPVLPFHAVVRPNNRMVILGSKIISSLGRLKPIFSSIFRAIGPAILGFLAIFWRSIPRISIPTFPIPAVNVAINFAFENPQFIVYLGGFLSAVGPVALRLLRIIFVRSVAVTVAENEMLLGLSTTDLHQRTKRKDPVLMIRPHGTRFTGQNAFAFRISPRYNSVEGLNLTPLNHMAIVQLGLSSIFGKLPSQSSDSLLEEISVQE